MQQLQVVPKDDLSVETTPEPFFSTKVIVQWVIAIVAAFGLGTWLVWWSASVQRSFTIQDIRAACQRVMPETVERCIDTVVIQRGGARR